MLKLDKLNTELIRRKLAKSSGTGKGEDILQMDKLARRMKIMAEAKPRGFGNPDDTTWEQVIKDDFMLNYVPVEEDDTERFDKNGKIRRRNESAAEEARQDHRSNATAPATLDLRQAGNDAVHAGSGVGCRDAGASD